MATSRKRGGKKAHKQRVAKRAKRKEEFMNEAKKVMMKELKAYQEANYPEQTLINSEEE